MTTFTTRRSLIRAAAVGALAVLALAGCSGDDGTTDGNGGADGNGSADGNGGADGNETRDGGDSQSAPLDLDGKTFTATQANGWVIVTDSTIQLTFDEGRISAQAGCNTLNGGATWTDALVLDGPLASTMMACPAGLEAQDQWLTKLLESEPRIALDGETLILGNDRNGLTMTEGG